MRVSLDSLSNSQLVDLVRVGMGLDPLYAATGSGSIEPCGSYANLERLRRLARPDCARCSGSGYYNGEYLDMYCPCTGLDPRGRAPGLKPGTGNNAFAYRRRHV